MAVEPGSGDRVSIDVISWVCHSANRAFQLATGTATPSPEMLDGWEREATEVSVRAVLDGATPEQLHERWCELKYEAGWVYGPDKDPAAKTHPCLLPYADLPDVERRKDALFHAIVRALAGP